MSYRQERIERLLAELKYEVTRGMLENEIGEFLGFQFIVPRSKEIPNGVVRCSFNCKPSFWYSQDDIKPGLSIVKNN